MCLSDRKIPDAVYKARARLLRERPELLQALRLMRATRGGTLAENSLRQCGSGGVQCRRVPGSNQYNAVHRAEGSEVAASDKVRAMQRNQLQTQQPARTQQPTSESGPVVTPRMLQSVSFGLSHIQSCDGCDHAVCVKTREMLRKVRNHKQRCTQDVQNCKACNLWQLTVEVHHRILATTGPPPS